MKIAVGIMTTFSPHCCIFLLLCQDIYLERVQWAAFSWSTWLHALSKESPEEKAALR